MMNINRLTSLISRINDEYSGTTGTLMEVCGTHTNAIRKLGIHRLLPNGIKLLSGPGCPVCVTGSGYIEQGIKLCRSSDITITTFGDLLKVPGNTGTLTEARADGGKVRIIYSPLDAVELARVNPNQEFIFLGVGFETTAPVIALAVKTAKEEGIKNFSVLPALKVLKPALEALLNDNSLKINGLIAPGHLSVITGAKAFAFLPEHYKLPTVITGFQAEEIWLGIAALLAQLKNDRIELENMYPQAVSDEGNLEAQQLIREIFKEEDTEWRGLGTIAASGLGFSKEYRDFDARIRFQLPVIKSIEPAGCLCGTILLGKAQPEECPHFGSGCLPEHPVGPCMVSSEGTCAAHFHYRSIV